MEEQRRNIAPIFRIIRLFWIYKRFIIGFNLAVVIIAIGVSLILPKWYTAKTTVIIKESEDMGIDLTGQISSLNILGMGTGTNLKVKKYIALLKSESISDSIIDRFNLKKIYKVKHREDVYKILAKNTNVSNNEDGTISIYCTYREDPLKAAEMANEYARLLVNLDTKLNKQQSTDFRKYIEENYLNVLAKMHENEQKLLSFQKKNLVVDIDKQTELLVQQIAELETQRIKNDIEIRYLKQIYPEHSPAIQDLIIKNKEISNTIIDLDTNTEYHNLPLKNLPDMAIEYLRTYRDVKIQEKVLEFLVVQLEKARIQEKKNFANIMVLDKAMVPERKSKPKRASIVIITTFFSFISSLFLVSAGDFMKRNKLIIREVMK